jgi:hypothetical protein
LRPSDAGRGRPAMSDVVDLSERREVAEAMRGIQKAVHEAMAYLPSEYWEDLAQSWVDDGYLPYEKIMQLFHPYWPEMEDEEPGA